MLRILAEMSCVFTEGGDKRDSTYHKILNLFLEQKISELLNLLPKSENFNENTESMKNLLILIRNFSIAGRLILPIFTMSLRLLTAVETYEHLEGTFILMLRRMNFVSSCTLLTLCLF